MVKRLLACRLVAIRQLIAGGNGKIPEYELSFQLGSNPIRIDELKIGMDVVLEYDVKDG